MIARVMSKRIGIGADLIEDMRIVLAHCRGELELEQVWPKPAAGAKKKLRPKRRGSGPKVLKPK